MLTAAFKCSTVACVNKQTPLSPPALRRRAIFLPAIVVLTVWLLNVVALRTHVGPQHAGFWMFIFIAASAVLVWSLGWRAKHSGVPPWRTVATAVTRIGQGRRFVGCDPAFVPGPPRMPAAPITLAVCAHV